MLNSKILYERDRFYVQARAFEEGVWFDVCEKKDTVLHPSYNDKIKKTFTGFLDSNWDWKCFSKLQSIEKALQKALKYLDELYYNELTKKHNIEYVTEIMNGISEGLKLKQEAYKSLEDELSSKSKYYDTTGVELLRP